MTRKLQLTPAHLLPPTGYRFTSISAEERDPRAGDLGTALPGDANGDGRVDINDLTIVLINFGKTGMTWGQGAMDGDPTGKVDINDLTIVLANFGQTAGSSTAGMAPVPEPGAIAILLADAIGLLACIGDGGPDQQQGWDLGHQLLDRPRDSPPAGKSWKTDCQSTRRSSECRENRPLNGTRTTAASIFVAGTGWSRSDCLSKSRQTGTAAQLN